MGTLQEVDLDDVRQILHGMADVPILAVASGGAIEDTQPHVAAASVDQDTAVAVADQDTAVAVADQELSRKAIEWATNLKDHAVIANLVASLPPAVLDEQVRLYQASSCGPVVPHASQAFVVYPHLLKSRKEAAQAFVTELLNAGWAPGTRLPRNAANQVAGKLVWSKSGMATLHDRAKALRRWHRQFRQEGRVCTKSMRSDEPSRSGGAIHVRSGSARPHVEYCRRRRRSGLQGAQLIRCDWVRDALYQWFVSIRYSADWKACEGKPAVAGNLNAWRVSREASCARKSSS